MANVISEMGVLWECFSCPCLLLRGEGSMENPSMVGRIQGQNKLYLSFAGVQFGAWTACCVCPPAINAAS